MIRPENAFVVSRLLSGLMVLASITAFAGIQQSNATDVTPNFVVIFTDDQGYQDVGCFGSPDIRTPRLDAMAEQGIRFTSFYAQPVCGPSRAALMTGCYPMRVAERGNTKQVHPILHEKEITVAEVLKTKGYATACFGKWDLAKHAQTGFFMELFPTRQGFDYFYGTPTSNDRIANLYRNEELIENATDLATLTQRYTDEAISFIKTNRKKPFFVYIPHTMPHTRLDASAKFKGKSKRGLYGDVIEEIDFNVGRILDALEELKLADNTYVLFTSDNGPWLVKNKNRADGHLKNDHGGSAGPLRSGKVSTFEGGVRVPTILWGPGRVTAGTTCDSIATTMDVLPTFAALAGADVPSDRVIDGEDIRHLFHGEFEKADPNKTYFYYLRVHLQAVRQGKWKLHLPRKKEPIGAAPFSRNHHIAPADRVGFNEPFLVDLENDIGETKNVAAKHPQVVIRLLGLAETMREDLGDYDRVGKNMRFFDPLDSRPTKPPVPTPRKRQPRKKKKTKSGQQVTVASPDYSSLAVTQRHSQPITHSFLACGQKTYIMSENGKPSWTYPAATRDGYVLDDGTIILTLSKSRNYKGGAVIKIDSSGKESLIWKGTQAEVNSAQPIANGNFVITEAGQNPRLLEISSEGKIVLEFPLACQKKNHHMQTRMARKTTDRTYLAPHLLNFAVYHYSPEGKVLGKLDTTVPGDDDHKIHTWPFTAIRHGEGNTLVCCTHGNRVVDFDKEGNIVWTLTNDDLPGDWLQDPCGGQVLPNGNIVITSYAGGRADRLAPKLFEVNRDKKVVWKYVDGQKVGIHHFQIITTNGKKLKGPALK